MVPRFTSSSKLGTDLHINVEALLVDERTKYQRLEIFQTSAFGKVMALDGVVQASEINNAWYHEPFIHLPLLLHPNPKTVLISGAADGAAIYQALLHPSVQRVVLCEIDQQVIDTATVHLSKLHHSVFDDDRVEIYSGDVFSYLKSEGGVYDVMALDLLDRNAVVEGKAEDEFYKMLSCSLAPNGFIAMRVGSLNTLSSVLNSTFQALKASFASLPYSHSLPPANTEMAFALCAAVKQELPNKDVLDTRIQERDLEGKLQLLDGLRIHALFALPPLYKRFLNSGRAMEMDL